MTDIERIEMVADPIILLSRTKHMQSEIDLLKSFMYEQQRLNEVLINFIKTLGEATGAFQIIEERAES